MHDVPSEDVDREQVKEILKAKCFHELPEPLRLKKTPPFEYKSQYFIVPQNNGKITVLTHYVLVGQIKTSAAVIQTLIRGTGYEVAWGSGNKVVERKALQWMLEQMGGTQYRHFSLSSESLI